MLFRGCLWLSSYLSDEPGRGNGLGTAVIILDHLPSTTRMTPAIASRVPATSLGVTRSNLAKKVWDRNNVIKGLLETMGLTTTTSARCTAKATAVTAMLDVNPAAAN